MLALRERRTQQLLNRLAAARSEATRRRLFDEIVESNLPLSDALARRYAMRSVELDDLTQVARAALVVAVQRYQPDRGTPFSAFAVPTIIGEIKRHFRDHGWVIRPPRRVQEQRARMLTRQSDIEQDEQRSVRLDELSEELGISRIQGDECATAWHSFRPLSLDAELGHDSEGLSNRLASVDAAIELLPDLVSLQQCLDLLSERDRMILRWRFYEDCTQREIGKRLGVTQVQVSRLLAHILARTRDLLEEPESRAS